jgi:DNA polymerase-1
MSRVWLVLDVPYLCWRAFHSTGRQDLTDNRGRPTGVLFGFLRGLSILAEQHATHNFVFCFDQGEGVRKKVYPNYKSNQKKTFLLKEDEEAHFAMRKQVEKLKDKHLPALGFKNVFSQDGYEADDLIAAICKSKYTVDDEVVIVSADKDFYQLLQEDRVCMWDPTKREAFTEKMFYSRFLISPRVWPNVKAMAGCSSDNIKGLKGVGEITAAHYFAKRLVESSKSFKKCKDFQDANDQYLTNLKLIQLPFEGTFKFRPVPQEPLI